ncbi:MAG: hypothetical protein ACFB4J_20040 [Elainellaceae cyanobacterium]
MPTLLGGCGGEAQQAASSVPEAGDGFGGFVLAEGFFFFGGGAVGQAIKSP